jgi:hypothetical protein
VTRSIVLRQYEPLVVPLVPSDLFLLDGGEKSIGIRSNTTWRVVDVMDPNHILVDAEELIDQTGGMNISAEGEKLSFRVSAITKPSNTFVYEASIGIIDAQDNMYWIFIKASAVS